MQYIPPVGGAANDPYVDADPNLGVEGSPVLAAALEHPLRELHALIVAAGLVPSSGDLTQVTQAVQALVAVGQAARSEVRQTVLIGPIDTSGFPSFLPATSANLNLSTQNISANVPLIVTAANGFGAGGAVNRVGKTTAQLAWNGLTANNTNYLYVDVAADGTLTTGATITAPVYQPGGTPAVTNGLMTYNYNEHKMYAGNGNTAPQAYRVFVGEAVAGAATITSTVAYAYQGRYVGPWTTPLPSVTTLTTAASNVGAPQLDWDVIVECTSTEGGYAVGDRFSLFTTGSWSGSSDTVIAPYSSRNVIGFMTGATNSITIPRTSDGYPVTLTSNKWKFRFHARRGW